MVLATDQFADLARQSACDGGLDGARIASVAHPIGGVSSEELRDRADAAVDEIVSLFLGSSRDAKQGSTGSG